VTVYFHTVPMGIVYAKTHAVMSSNKPVRGKLRSKFWRLL